MALYQAEYRSKIRREKTKEAIALAMEDRWEEAVEVNRAILELFPEDIEAYNRLGKAFLEQGGYEEARSAFTRALQLSPSNIIARKNLERLTHLEKEEQVPKKGRKLGPQHFLEESGKTGIAVLENLTDRKVLAKITAGDAVTLGIVDRRLIVQSSEGEYLGQMPPRPGLRLIRLMQGGNQYEAAVTSLGGDEVTVIILEVFRHHEQRHITSFPTRGEQYRLYSRSALVEFDLPEEEDEEMEATLTPEGEGDGEVTSIPPRAGFPQDPSVEDEDES